MRVNIAIRRFFLWLVIVGLNNGTSAAQTDTLRVMAYNVLNYGEYPLCQGPNGYYHACLDTVVQFANPDIISLEKMGSIGYTAVAGFQDSILQFALNAAYPGRFNYCPFTNNAGSKTFSVLFYNQQKLGFVTTTCNYPDDEDINTYKLFYKDPNLAATHDTTFLYVTVNHDISGSGSEASRGMQIAGEMTQIQTHFSHLANMINMGDFNVRNSGEQAYQALAFPADTNFRYYDPVFIPDAVFSYPADWDSYPVTFGSYLTTSTRQSASIPNSCGTNGGAKDWYDHIFLSPWLINNANYISYIPHSFRVIGNDGHRVGISVNDPPANTSAPPSVINSLFQMSNKYPVMVSLLVTQNTTGISPVDPEKYPSAISACNLPGEHAAITNPAERDITLHFSDGMIGRTVFLECTDMPGRSLIHRSITVNDKVMQLSCNLAPGIYCLKITDGQHILCQTLFTRK